MFAEFFCRLLLSSFVVLQLTNDLSLNDVSVDAAAVTSGPSDLKSCRKTKDLLFRCCTRTVRELLRTRPSGTSQINPQTDRANINSGTSQVDHQIRNGLPVQTADQFDPLSETAQNREGNQMNSWSVSSQPSSSQLGSSQPSSSQPSASQLGSSQFDSSNAQPTSFTPIRSLQFISGLSQPSSTFTFKRSVRPPLSDSPVLYLPPPLPLPSPLALPLPLYTPPSVATSLDSLHSSSPSFVFPTDSNLDMTQCSQVDCSATLHDLNHFRCFFFIDDDIVISSRSDVPEIPEFVELSAVETAVTSASADASDDDGNSQGRTRLRRSALSTLKRQTTSSSSSSVDRSRDDCIRACRESTLTENISADADEISSPITVDNIEACVAQFCGVVERARMISDDVGTESMEGDGGQEVMSKRWGSRVCMETHCRPVAFDMTLYVNCGITYCG